MMSQPPGHSATSDLDARSKRKAAMLFFGLSFVFWVVSALSRSTENARLGIETSWDVPWVLEGSSLLISALLFFLVWEIEARWPIAPGNILRKTAAHLAGTLVFSALHIVLMVMIREAYWLVVHASEYTYLREPLQDILYDYRKDAVTYVTILMIIYLSKNLDIAQAERIEARTDAASKHRILLKCGGRTVMLPAIDIEAVQADGNYILVHTANERHHARMPLSECLNLLTAAGRDVRRVHKSWILDFDKVRQVRKTAKGDVDYVLESGREIRGSRRYLSAATAS